MFHKARIKLTTWYLLIMFVVSSFFSLTVYKVLTFEVDRFVLMQKAKMERRMRDPNFMPYDLRLRFPTPPIALVIDMELVRETKTRIALSLLVVDATILLISGMLAYFLAGKTLSPIQSMIEDQKRFISDASHELRTPLTALKSAIEVNLRDRNMSLEDAKELLSSARDQVDRLTMLSNSLLELSSHEVSENTKDDNVGRVDLTEVVKNVVTEMSPLADERKVSLRIIPSKSFFTKATRHDMHRLVSILLDNAIKYSKPNTQISLTLTEINNSLILKIKDQGIGIAKVDIPNIFKRFYRADAARAKQNANGYGLGLAIAKKIVDLYKGKIEAKSQSGVGSEFIVTLPITKRIKVYG